MILAQMLETGAERSRYTAMDDWILVRKVDKPAGILHVPGTARDENRFEQYAVVVSVGPGRITEHGKLVEPRVKCGDLVLGKDGPRVFHAMPQDKNVAAIRERDIVSLVDPSVPMGPPATTN